jgi:hypothetical protein
MQASAASNAAKSAEGLSEADVQRDPIPAQGAVGKTVHVHGAALEPPLTQNALHARTNGRQKHKGRTGSG